MQDRGDILLTADVNAGMQNRGTSVVACMTRCDGGWTYRNCSDLSMAGETRVASEAAGAVGAIFQKLFGDAMQLSTRDPRRAGAVRVVQLTQALKCHPPGVLVRVLGTTKGAGGSPHVHDVEMTGDITADIEALVLLAKGFSSRAVDVKTGFQMVTDKPFSPIIRLANNAEFPVEAVEHARKEAGGAMLFAHLDMKGQVFDSISDIELGPQDIILPGQVEASLKILAQVAAAGRGSLVEYIAAFRPEPIAWKYSEKRARKDPVSKLEGQMKKLSAGHE